MQWQPDPQLATRRQPVRSSCRVQSDLNRNAQHSRGRAHSVSGKANRAAGDHSLYLSYVCGARQSDVLEHVSARRPSRKLSSTCRRRPPIGHRWAQWYRNSARSRSLSPRRCGCLIRWLKVTRCKLVSTAVGWALILIRPSCARRTVNHSAVFRAIRETWL